MLAGEGLGFGKFGECFEGGSEQEADAQAGLLCGGTQKSVVTNTSEAFGKSVEEPAPDEFVRRE